METSKAEELDTFLKTLKIHNKDLDTCFNDALAIKHILELTQSIADQSKREERERIWKEAQGKAIEYVMDEFVEDEKYIHMGDLAQLLT